MTRFDQFAPLLQQGLAHHHAGRIAQAESIYRQVLAGQPDNPDALHLLGVVALNSRHFKEAADLIRRAIQVAPRVAFYHNNLGNALTDLGRLEEAFYSYCEAIRLDPNLADAHSNLANSLREQARFAEAVASAQKAVNLRPDLPTAHNTLGLLLKDQGRIEEALASYREAFRLDPRFADAHTNLCYVSHFLYGDDGPRMLAEHVNWAKQHAAPLVTGPERSRRVGDSERSRGAPSPLFQNTRDPQRRLRVGFVSADFRDHPVGWFIHPLFHRHDRAQFEFFVYSGKDTPDETNRRLREVVENWHDTQPWSDEQLATRIREDRIDILFNLAGHTNGGRCLVFARRPAPVQVTYLGYPNTTGMSQIDYRITDAIADPVAQTDDLHVEKLIRLPGCFLCYSDFNHAPAVTERPADGACVFASFNNAAKISPQTVRMWRRVLDAAPDARLLIKTSSYGDKATAELARRRLVSEGLPDSRLDVRGPAKPYQKHLECYGDVDVALDTYPYNGTTTTCESLWMGVPVVTLAGPTHVTRVGASILQNAGLSELVAKSEDDYVRLAVELASDAARRRELRHTMRERMLRSPLMDAEAFARSFERVIRQMWMDWCARPSS